MDKLCCDICGGILTYGDYMDYARDIFERSDTDGDDCTVYYDENCGPWYLNFKRQFEAERLKQVQAEHRAENKCQYYGAFFTGFFTQKCGKPKDY